MPLSHDDKEFLERLGTLFDRNLARVSWSALPPHCLLLTSTSWPDAEREMGLSRQAVRRRFWRVFNQLYISAYETVMIVEQYLGADDRQAAMAAARERLHRMTAPCTDASFESADALLPGSAPSIVPRSD